MSGRLILLACALAAMVLACSGDDSPNQPSPSETVTPEMSATPELPPNATGLPPTVIVPLGTTCEVEFPPQNQRKVRPNGADLGVGYEPFCIAWTDIYSDEIGFRVELRYGQNPIVYNVTANTNEVYPPPQDWPLANGKGDVQVMVYAVRPSGVEVVEGFVLQIN